MPNKSAVTLLGDVTAFQTPIDGLAERFERVRFLYRNSEELAHAIYLDEDSLQSAMAL